MASACCVCNTKHIYLVGAICISGRSRVATIRRQPAAGVRPGIPVYAIYLPSRRFMRLQHSYCNRTCTAFTPTALSMMAARYLVVAGLFPSALAIVPNKSAPPHATLLPPSCSPCSRRPRLPVDSSTMQGGAGAHWRRGRGAVLSGRGSILGSLLDPTWPLPFTHTPKPCPLSPENCIYPNHPTSLSLRASQMCTMVPALPTSRRQSAVTKPTSWATSMSASSLPPPPPTPPSPRPPRPPLSTSSLLSLALISLSVTPLRRVG